jgi:hypothetical protein
MNKTNKKVVKRCANVDTWLYGHVYVHIVAKIFNIYLMYSDILRFFLLQRMGKWTDGTYGEFKVRAELVCTRPYTRHHQIWD